MSNAVLIPKTRPIDVPDPSPITSLEFIKQIIDNVNAQLSSIDGELSRANNGDNQHVSK
jgi:hypothetical protein